jgi:hypothetical protein
LLLSSIGSVIGDRNSRQEWISRSKTATNAAAGERYISHDQAAPQSGDANMKMTATTRQVSSKSTRLGIVLIWAVAQASGFVAHEFRRG